jgi:hypothetical protein
MWVVQQAGGSREMARWFSMIVANESVDIGVGSLSSIRDSAISGQDVR